MHEMMMTPLLPRGSMKMLLATAAAFVQRQRCHQSLPFAKHAFKCSARAMTTSSTDATESNGKRFFDMEQRNWEQGFKAYDAGFGPLTRQTIPTLLSDGGFSPYMRHSQFQFLDVATGPGFVLTAAIDYGMKLDLPQEFHPNFQLTGLDITQNFLHMAEHRINAQLQELEQQHKRQFSIDFVEGGAQNRYPFLVNPSTPSYVISVSCTFSTLKSFYANLTECFDQEADSVSLRGLLQRRLKAFE